MIGPFEKFADTMLYSELNADRNARYLVDRSALALPDDEAIDREASVSLKRNGMRRHEREFVGCSLILGDGRKIQGHSLLYSRALPDEVLGAIRAHIDKIAEMHGPGTIWFCEQPVHMIRQDDSIVVIGDPPMVHLRTIYGHEAQAVPL